MPVSKKEVNRLTILFTVTYMISYITRINYGAVISEMEKATNISRSLLSMSVTGSFVTYGAGQIISGILGDKVSAKKLVSYGFIVTVLMNFLIPICKNPYQMLAVWCINGFAQSFMWPPLVKLMTSLFSEEDYKGAAVKVSWGSSLGTILIYLISPLIITISGWKAVFLFSAACGIVMLFIWNKYSYDTKAEEKIAPLPERKVSGILFTPLMLGIMLAIILQGMLKDGVTTWMPSYISETYSLSSVISILTGVILPIFSIICFSAVSQLYKKVFTNPILCAGVIFGAGALFAFGLYLLSGRNALLSVVFSALLTGCMHGVNLLLICMVPAYFKKYGNVSTISGVLNSCTYIGSAVSTYGIAVLSENSGWKFTIFIWTLIALSGTISCIVNIRPWKRVMSAK
ncbi:MAG: MFS transporter [Clostridia bacterium]|nr:MFS transporter [Clostridia bacterium]